MPSGSIIVGLGLTKCPPVIPFLPYQVLSGCDVGCLLGREGVGNVCAAGDVEMAVPLRR